MFRLAAGPRHGRPYQRQSRDMPEIPAMVMQLAGYCRYRNIPLEIFEELPFDVRLEIIAIAVDFDPLATFDVLKWLHHCERRYNTIDVYNALSNAPIPPEFGRPYWMDPGDYYARLEQDDSTASMDERNSADAPNLME